MNEYIRNCRPCTSFFFFVFCWLAQTRLVPALAQVEASLKQVKPWIEERSDYPAALAKLLPLLASNAIARTCPQLFLTIGMCYHMMGKARAARQNYQVSLRLDGSVANHVCRRNLMMLHREQGDLDAATNQAKVLIEQDPLNASHQFDLGVIESARGDRLAAVSAYTRAVELDPAYMEAYVNLDASLLQLNDLAKCFQYAQRAIRHCKGFWTNPLQRPSRMLPGLEAKPWHDPRGFRLCEILEANYQVIREDLDALLCDGDGACVGQRGNHDGTLVSRGSWREHVLLTGQNGCLNPNLAGCWSKCSRTLRILSALPEIVALAASGQGEVLFSALAPGSTLRPHCGMGFCAICGCVFSFSSLIA